MEKFVETWSETMFPQNKTLFYSIVRAELEKPQDHKRISLASRCVRQLMRTSIDEGSAEGVYYKLFFEEPLRIFETCEYLRSLKNLTSRINSSIDDPFLMQKMLEQNLNSWAHDEIEIIIMRNSCTLSIDETQVLEVKTENFDPHWAIVFGKIALQKQIKKIEIIDEESFSAVDRTAWPSSFAKNFALIHPDHPKWADAVGERRLIYRACEIRSLLLTDHFSFSYPVQSEAELRIYYPEQ